jgi:hypothetical protein
MIKEGPIKETSAEWSLIHVPQNPILVTAAEGYAQRYNMNPRNVLTLFIEKNINTLLRSQYETLNATGLDKSVSFAKYALARIHI